MIAVLHVTMGKKLREVPRQKVAKMKTFISLMHYGRSLDGGYATSCLAFCFRQNTLKHFCADKPKALTNKSQYYKEMRRCLSKFIDT